MDEYRSADFTDVEVTDMDFRGYAAVFDAPWGAEQTEEAGYVETLARGAFRKALMVGNNVPLLWQHDRKDMLATTQSGNLRLKEDGRGLLVEAKLPKSPLGEYVRAGIEAGDIRGMSYGRRLQREDSKVSRRDGVFHRHVTNIRRLLDTTLTWEPAYPATFVELRSAGFTAAPLQELVDGLEEQIDDAATEAPPDRVSPYIGRMADVLISQLERQGGVSL